MFVAVVYKFHFDTDPASHRDTGGWEAFLGNTKEEAVQAAEFQTRQWESQPAYVTDPTTGRQKLKQYGPYQILVGELTEEAVRFPVILQLINSDCGEEVPF